MEETMPSQTGRQIDRPASAQAVWWPLCAFKILPALILLAIIFLAIAIPFIARYHLAFGAAAGIYSCFIALLVLVLTPGIDNLRTRMQPSSALLIALWCVPYLLYAAGTRDFRWTSLVRLIVISAPLLIIYRLRPVRDPLRFSFQDLLVAVWLIAVVLGRQLKNIWNVPVNLDFMGRLFLVAIASWTWVFVRRVPNLGYRFSFSPNTFRAAAANFGIFAVIAIPGGLALHFTRWNPHWHSLTGFCIDLLELFLFVALLEELFFRGFLQSLLSANLHSKWKAQAIVASLFGLFHILHAPFPNWRYVLLATVAGWFYGAAFTSSGNLMAPCLTHAMVDTVWRTFFSKS